MIVETTAEFRDLSVADIKAALADVDSDIDIAREVARLQKGYLRHYQKACEEQGEVVTELLLKEPGSEIESIAMQMLSQAIANEIGEELRLVLS